MQSARRGKHGVFAAVAALAMTTGSVALAHDPSELGAGPGQKNKVSVGRHRHDETQEKSAIDMNRASDGMAMSDHDSADQMAMAHDHDDDMSNKTFGQRLVRWLGKLHIIAIHFPIAMIIGAFAVELFGLWRKSAFYQEAARVMLFVGALGAVGAATLGWFAGGFYVTDRNPVLMAHRWLGTSIALLAVVLVYLAVAARRIPDRPRMFYWSLLGALTLAVAVQGFLGGTFMHGGLRHLAF